MLPAEEANRRYFRRAYRTGRHGWAVEEPSPHAVRRLRRLRGRVPGGRLLDLGCGEGRHAIAAARMGFRVTAVDYEPLALQRARRIAGCKDAGRIRFVCGNAFALPFEDAAFDVLLDYGCLHHQRKADWPDYLRSVTRVLRPEGYFVLSVFSPRFRFFSDSDRRWHIARGAYRRCFTPEDLCELFGADFDFLHLEEERGEGRGFWHCLLRRDEYG